MSTTEFLVGSETCYAIIVPCNVHLLIASLLSTKRIHTVAMHKTVNEHCDLSVDDSLSANRTVRHENVLII
jgi:hypothetical protein